MNTRSHENNAGALSKNELWAALAVLSQGDISRDWLENNLARFHRRLHGAKDVGALGKIVFAELARILSIERGSLYVMEQEEDRACLMLLASFPAGGKTVPRRIPFDGIAGRWNSSAEKLLLAHFSGDSAVPLSAGRKGAPATTVLLPVVFEDELQAVIQIHARRSFDLTQRQFLEHMSEILGIVLHKMEADLSTQKLLRQSVSLAKELQKQQSRLQQTNHELAEKARELTEQKSELENKNREVEQARQSLQEKAGQLALSSKYKSEFLANMSHELRTPLNSLLLLARQLIDNQEENLTERQLEFARVIHASGQDLLRLINETLDLSKIESGTVTLDVGEMPFWDLHQRMERSFRPMAHSHNLDFFIEMDPALPGTMLTDGKRLEQILKNLLSNAFKFTRHGRVVFRVQRAKSGWNPENPQLHQASAVVAFSVVDTGIGIPPEKQKVVFEAFQQGDGSTSRNFGGTGLGLTISRELARLLGGEIQLASAVGKGSTFTLYLPQQMRPAPTYAPEVKFDTPDLFPVEPQKNVDDGSAIQSGDRVLLCVEDDTDFAACLADLSKAHGFKTVVASRGEGVMELIRKYSPGALTLDLTLPDIDGWKILERLKNNLETRHIPIAVISAESECVRGLKLGAAVFLVKPVKLPVLENIFEKFKSFHPSRKKKLLLVQPEGAARARFIEWLSPSHVQVTPLKSGREALAALKAQAFDCLAVELRPGDKNGFQLLEKIGNAGFIDLPLLIFHNGELRSREERELQKLTRGLFVKEVHSFERLLDEATLFLHVKAADLPEPARAVLEKLHRNNNVLAGKKALVVDDDIRNIFAMTSLLERYGMEIVSTESGREAIGILQRGAQPDLALMDVMMPDFDGYNTIRAIRQMNSFKSLPIIAVTAKAMKEDRAKCLQAGASDYLTKPVDTEQLLATLRLWLYR